jgi:hypothetical protein
MELVCARFPCWFARPRKPTTVLVPGLFRRNPRQHNRFTATFQRELARVDLRREQPIDVRLGLRRQGLRPDRSRPVQDPHTLRGGCVASLAMLASLASLAIFPPRSHSA